MTLQDQSGSLMIRVAIQVTNLSGERYWGYDAQLPPQVQIGVNINIVGLEQKSELSAEAPFVFTVTYAPSIAQLSVKGKAQVTAEKNEISKMLEEHKQNKPPSTAVIQAVSSIAMAEAIILSKSLGVPPPLPPMGMPAEQPAQNLKRSDSRYTT